ncbi:hypothetical protein MMC25_006512 [Agyrium rufum]|nr:hypothetical protein [Agyrium rufum]
MSSPSTSSPPTAAQLAQIPALSPPLGYTSNLVNPYSDGRDLTIVGSLLVAITLICVCLRFYTKLCITHKSADDVTCFLALLGTLAFFGSCVFSVHEEIGVHEWNVSVLQLTSKNFLVSTYLISIIVQPTLICVKLTFFFLYLHIFRVNQALRVCIIGGAVITTLFYTGFFIAQMVFLTPSPNETWLVHFSRPFTSGTDETEIPLGAFGVVIDFYILLLPVAAIIPLQLPRVRKIGVLIIFLTGSLACVASILSLHYRIVLLRYPDSTWNILPTILCALVEMCIGLIVSSIPHLVSLYRHHRKDLIRLSSISLQVIRGQIVRISPFSRSSSSRQSRSSRNANSNEGGRSATSAELDNNPTIIRRPEPARLETRILRGVEGKGKFMTWGSGEWPLAVGEKRSSAFETFVPQRLDEDTNKEEDRESELGFPIGNYWDREEKGGRSRATHRDEWGD